MSVAVVFIELNVAISIWSLVNKLSKKKHLTLRVYINSCLCHVISNSCGGGEPQNNKKSPKPHHTSADTNFYFCWSLWQRTNEKANIKGLYLFMSPQFKLETIL